MKHISATPSGRRMVAAARMAPKVACDRPAPQRAVDKWVLLKDAVQARESLGVSDRDLSVLSALLSFHPGTILDSCQQATVFPSNATLARRLHGMPESTLRRHIAALVKAGLIARRDSPNGKRFARRGHDGCIERAFGFDLGPLRSRAAEIAAAAEDARAKAVELRRIREEVSVSLREASAVLQRISQLSQIGQSELAATLAEMQRQIRRKLKLDALYKLYDRSQLVLRELRSILAAGTDEMGGNGIQNERHHNSIEPEDSDSEKGEIDNDQGDASASISLTSILAAAPDIVDYTTQPVRTWRDLVAVSAFVAPMMGISSALWNQARLCMGDDTAAATVACILQRAHRIRSPGAYLRTLVKKAEASSYSVAVMINGLTREARLPVRRHTYHRLGPGSSTALSAP